MVWSDLLSLWALLSSNVWGPIYTNQQGTNAQQGPTLMTPSDPDYLSKAPALKSTITLGVKASVC